MINPNKMVEFEEYCPRCKYLDYEEEEYPCCECLEHPMNEYSHKPVKYETRMNRYLKKEVS